MRRQTLCERVGIRVASACAEACALRLRNAFRHKADATRWQRLRLPRLRQGVSVNSTSRNAFRHKADATRWQRLRLPRLRQGVSVNSASRSSQVASRLENRLQ